MSYAKLQQGFREVILLRESLALLEWDSAVLMPHTAAARRAKQMACLEAVSYDRLQFLAEEIACNGVEDCPEDAWHQANLREMRRQVNHILLVPKDIQVRLSEAKQICEMWWRSARKSSDFSLVEPYLSEVVSLSREALAAQAEGLGVSMMDAAIAAFEPELPAARAGRLLKEHAAFVRGFYPIAREKADKRCRDHPGCWQLSLSEQDRLCREMCSRVGLPLEASRVDVSAHPFSFGYPDDSRITVRFDPDRALLALSAAIHETGHAVYDIQLPSAWNTQPVGQSRGMLLHESQSLTMEMQAGRSREFLQWLTTYIQQNYNSDITLEAILAESWRVTSSAIRVDADEVTYPLHILLRFHLEQELLSGALQVSDLPQAFRAGQKELLGLEIADDVEGCLQDIHWYIGAFGYFPCYALGAMAAAQLFQAALRDDPNIPLDLENGEFTRIRDWMGQHVHAQGSRFSTNEVLECVTGAGLDCAALQSHVQQRYS
ncbi:MAG: carboxypeptidase M32 [Alphaproteobacteria bacterium]|nr:carboxypeptidase M32 [Alphaproteobacteria bacterium]